MSTSIAKKGIDASATLIANQISKANSSFANFANNNSLNQKSSFKEIKYDQPIGPNLPPMQGPMQPSSNIQNFGGGDVDVDEIKNRYGLNNNQDSGITKRNLSSSNMNQDSIGTDTGSREDRQSNADTYLSNPNIGDAQQVTEDRIQAQRDAVDKGDEAAERATKYRGLNKGGLATRTKRRKKK
jgi:hypothetical protein